MADVKPLKIDYDDDGVPSGIGEFQSGDTIEPALVSLSGATVLTNSSSIDYVYVDDGNLLKKIDLSSIFYTNYGSSSIDAAENKCRLNGIT